MLPQPCILKREAGIMSRETIKAALDLIPIGPDAPCSSIGDGVFCEIACNIFLYVHWGPVGVHADDAGMTYGYVLKGREEGTGQFELLVADEDSKTNEPKHLGYLDTDSAFIINSNLDHEVDTGDGDLLIFLTQDFNNDHVHHPGERASNEAIDKWLAAKREPRIPPVTIDQWIDQLPGHFDAWLERAKTQPITPFIL